MPISDSGMATVGITDERSEPRNRKTTTVTMSQRLDQAADDLVDRAVHEFGGIVDDLAVEPVRQQRLNFGKDLVHAGDHVEQIGRGRDLDADIDRLLAVEADLRFVILGAEHDVGDVLEPHHGAAGLLEHQVAEFFGRMQAGRGGQIDLHHLALGVADAGYVVVGGERLADVGGGEPERRELFRIEPGAQGEDLLAEQFRGLHAGHRLQLRLHHADEVIGDLVRRQRVAVKADIHGVDRSGRS